VYPTIDEQLREARRILEEVVAPEVHGDYPADTLRAVLSALQMLEGAWSEVLPFLHWDNQATAELLDAALDHGVGPLGDRIRTALARPPADAIDVGAAHRRNLELRELLSELVPTAFQWDTGAVDAGIVDHLRERARRYPFSAF
jgi:hypothetical protein